MSIIVIIDDLDHFNLAQTDFSLQPLFDLSECVWLVVDEQAKGFKLQLLWHLNHKLNTFWKTSVAT